VPQDVTSVLVRRHAALELSVVSHSSFTGNLQKLFVIVDARTLEKQIMIFGEDALISCALSSECRSVRYIDLRRRNEVLDM